MLSHEQKQQWKAHIESWMERAKVRWHEVSEKTQAAVSQCKEKLHKDKK